MNVPRFYVYIWLREDGTPYYVGKGTRTRAHDHHRCGPAPLCPRRIIKQFFHSEAAAFEVEKFLIETYGRKDIGTGCLTNLTDGGEGPVGAIRSAEYRKKLGDRKRGTKHSKETKRLMSLVRKGKTHPAFSEQWRANLRAARQRRAPYSDETRRKIGLAQIGRVPTEETRKKISVAKMGHSVSAEARRKIGDAQRGRNQTPEHVANMRAALTGKPRSEAARQRLREAWVRRKANAAGRTETSS